MKITTKEELADYIIEKMNEFITYDRKAIHDLCENRVTANGFIDHPTVQVDKVTSCGPYGPQVGDYALGLIGVLNGIVGVIDVDGPKKERGLIAGMYSKRDHKLINFDRADNQLTPDYSYLNEAQRFIPDYAEHMTLQGISKELNLTFTGPGWYIGKSSSILILPTGDKDVFRVCAYKSDVSTAFNQIVNAPVRVDERKL